MTNENEAVSRTLALAWGLAAAPQRGPKRELTPERIVEAAVAIADAEGLAAVTMQRVAQTFEFSTMALYRYVATKDELHRLMLDASLSSAEGVIDAEHWRTGLREFLSELLDGYRRHPWALDIPLSSDIHFMPGQMRVADRALRAMRTLPATEPAKLSVLMLFAAFARGHAAVEREVLAGGEISPETRALVEEAVTPGRFPDVALLVRSGTYFGDADAGAFAEDDTALIFEFALGVLLDGLESTFSGAQTPPPAPAVDLSPPEALERAEAELRAGIELRKQAQRRVREAERAEAELRRTRDRAKEAAKAHAKQLRSGG
ncbi:TetR/AcrR family transcriptional regulator [Leucobacter sp. HNU]|uniref:TetR/AcrR family transcriptional regulator n=1 Tax=Leucobacter sp. HNU TaxID=3236805 RepID=UPI003A80AFE5